MTQCQPFRVNNTHLHWQAHAAHQTRALLANPEPPSVPVRGQQGTLDLLHSRALSSARELTKFNFLPSIPGGDTVLTYINNRLLELDVKSVIRKGNNGVLSTAHVLCALSMELKKRNLQKQRNPSAFWSREAVFKHRWGNWTILTFKFQSQYVVIILSAVYSHVLAISILT